MYTPSRDPPCTVLRLAREMKLENPNLAGKHVAPLCEAKMEKIRVRGHCLYTFKPRSLFLGCEANQSEREKMGTNYWVT